MRSGVALNLDLQCSMDVDPGEVLFHAAGTATVDMA